MKKVFKPRARLLLQLGNQLIRNENIALVELIKNSHDADAQTCEVTLKDIDSKDSGEIIIKDDGVGMSFDVVEKIWLEPGADFKDLVLKGGQLPLGLTYPAKRTPIGEKGIGRFGVHKLGDEVELITKDINSSKEVVVRINWKDFGKVTYLDQANFDVLERKPEIFKGKKTGTLITIKDLRIEWDKTMFKELQRTVLSLSTPFAEKVKDSFLPSLTLYLADRKKQEEWQEAILTVDQVKELSLWKVKCTLKGDKITKFRYEFMPYSKMDKLSSKVLSEKDRAFTNYFSQLRGSNDELMDLSKFRIGQIEIELYLFYLGSRILKLSTSDPMLLNDFMSENGGVRVYRGGMRVYDYGEPEDDWLNLDQKRISNVGGSIGNKLILGAISLDRKESLDLIEKTNREGFVETDAYKVFKQSVLQVVRIVNHFRNIDKEKIKEIYEGSSKTEPVLHDVDLLKNITEDRIKEFSEDLSAKKKKEVNKMKEEIMDGLESIKDQYIKTHDILIKSAGAGLSLGVVIHEIEKRIKELRRAIDQTDFDLKRVKNLVISISKLIGNYSVLLSNTKKEKVLLTKVIEDAIFNCSFRFEAHKISLIESYKKSKAVKIKCAPNIIIGALLNIFDNSLYWLHTYDIKDRKILIDIREYKNEIGVIVVDNGKGFLISAEDALKPFITMKTGGTGLGLHIADEMMKVHKGRLVIRDFKEVKKLPKEFYEGAIVELIFKKNETK
ncbi:MAG: ATP-binding protein [Thermoproteota archaeon]|nr:ATP-binding protein [Thermoproteota archaeon]